jgi:hypothetical protein
VSGAHGKSRHLTPLTGPLGLHLRGGFYIYVKTTYAEKHANASACEYTVDLIRQPPRVTLGGVRCFGGK